MPGFPKAKPPANRVALEVISALAKKRLGGHSIRYAGADRR